MTVCDWCLQEIIPGDEIIAPVHPKIQDKFGGATVTVHREECYRMIEEEMYEVWYEREFPEETLGGSWEDE